EGLHAGLVVALDLAWAMSAKQRRQGAGVGARGVLLDGQDLVGGGFAAALEHVGEALGDALGAARAQAFDAQIGRTGIVDGDDALVRGVDVAALGVGLVGLLFDGGAAGPASASGAAVHGEVAALTVFGHGHGAIEAVG